MVPKKLDLTKENLNALLGQNSFKQKTPSTFSRASGQTSGGRGPGKRKPALRGSENWKNTVLNSRFVLAYKVFLQGSRPEKQAVGDVSHNVH